MSWIPFNGADFGASPHTPGIDANLVFADASHFVDFLRLEQESVTKIPVIVQLKPSAPNEKAVQMQAFASELKKYNCSVPSVYLDQHANSFCTAVFTSEYCQMVLATMRGDTSIVGSMIDRFDLQMPVIPLRAKLKILGQIPLSKDLEKRDRAGETLIGVIDSGCPFAHRSLRSASGNGTRLIGIWDQDASPAFGSIGNGGFLPPDMGYGCEIRRDALNTLMTRNTRNGVVDEGACYEMAGYQGLRHRMTHGAAVLDLFAGPLPFSARSSADPDQVPTWAVDPNDSVHKADIAFVQLPSDAVQDSSSAGLTRLLLDGLRYIISFACEKTTKIVVNISDGTSRASHDGSSLFELAMEELISEQRKLNRELVIVVAGGNSRNELRHGLLSFDRPKESLTLRLPPDCETAAHLLIRIPESAKRVKLWVTAPDGQKKPISVKVGQAFNWVEKGSTTCSVVVPAGAPGRAICALIAWAPTVSDDLNRVAALAGDWKISIEGKLQASEDVHFYIARNRANH